MDLSFLNSFLEIPHFTMESVESIRRSLPRDAWVTSIDLVDAYFHIPIHRGYRKQIDFRLQTQYTNSGHCRLAKMMTEIKMLVHMMGINLCQYLDDWLIYSPSHDQCLRDTTSAQSRPHDGPPHSRQEVGTDPTTEIPFWGDTSST